MLVASFILLLLVNTAIFAQDGLPSLEEVKAKGVQQSNYRASNPLATDPGKVPEANIQAFHAEIKPILDAACVQCHGGDLEEGGLRVDRLDPNLITGDDADWWLEVLDVISNGEMPPAGEGVELVGEDRSKIVQWLSAEIQVASQVNRNEHGHSSFRRMTRYEYNYALQDLLGLPYDFAADLPPETHSEDGFQNSSEMLQMSVRQFETYREIGRKALLKSTVTGHQPEVFYYSISMDQDMEDARVALEAKKKRQAIARKEAAERKAAADEEAAKIEAAAEKVMTAEAKKEKAARKAAKEAIAQKEAERKAAKKKTPRRVSSEGVFRDLETDEEIKASYYYFEAKMSHRPVSELPTAPSDFTRILVLPAGGERTIDLGDDLPDSGMLKVRIRAARAETDNSGRPALRLKFGYQPSNDSHTKRRVDKRDVTIMAPPDAPEFYQWEIPLSEVPRNNYRGETKMGDLPNPTEYLILTNSATGGRTGAQCDIQIDYIEISTPCYEQWPPKSHNAIFIDSDNKDDEPVYAREVLANFLPKAWRRPVSDAEMDRQVSLFKKIRPGCSDFQETMIEVLATTLASSNFLYVVQGESEATDTSATDTSAGDDAQGQSDLELATRLSLFLWCSIPDKELLDLASQGKLNNPTTLAAQTKRMLADARCQRFTEHFVRQWLGMQLLDYLDVEKEAYPEFDDELKEAMQQEPIAFFHEMLQNNRSVLDILHADYTMANERLAQHYGLEDVYGSSFRKVSLNADGRRGGLMTQAGLLAMNSDGKNSHPLKRSIWLLERLLNDPPPPPPPAVPQIDLADPEIAKLTLKEQIENHRNDPACISCHAKIDPWGIAFENFDAIGNWRDTVDDKPVDASSRLFNNQELDGVVGLKRFLLANRQDQFCRAVVHKLSTFALGRPLSFADRSSVDQITAQLRKQDDGLTTLVTLIVTSDLFQSK